MKKETDISHKFFYFIFLNVLILRAQEFIQQKKLKSKIKAFILTEKINISWESFLHNKCNRFVKVLYGIASENMYFC